MDSLKDIVANHSFFNGMRAEYIDTIASFASEVEFKKGDYLFHEGREADSFYIIRAGRVALRIFVEGRGFTDIEQVGANELAGWSWMVSPHKFHFSAVSIEPTKAVMFDAKKLYEAMEADHSLGYDIMKRFADVIVHRLAMTRGQLVVNR